MDVQDESLNPFDIETCMCRFCSIWAQVKQAMPRHDDEGFLQQFLTHTSFFLAQLTSMTYQVAVMHGITYSEESWEAIRGVMVETINGFPLPPNLGSLDEMPDDRGPPNRN